MKKFQETFTDPQALKTLANNVKEFIDENYLTNDINGKEYVNVEGWQYAGSLLGIYPVIESLSRENDLYLCHVSLRDVSTADIVGGGYGACRLKESTRFNKEYAVISMAQTRALSKAYRMLISFIMKLAGYETTPTEEMITDPSPENSIPKDIVQEYFQVLMSEQITSQEKNKMLDGFKIMDQNRMQEAINKMKATIKQRLHSQDIVKADQDIVNELAGK